MKAPAILMGLLAVFGGNRADGQPVIRRPEAARVPTLNIALFLEAIADVETGNKAWRVGEHGERGRCQFRADTWRRYTNADFAGWAPRDCEFTRRVERAHVEHLVRVLFSPGQIPEPALLAAAWRYGEHAAVQQVRSDYAVRVVNLYWDLAGPRSEGIR